MDREKSFITRLGDLAYFFMVGMSAFWILNVLLEAFLNPAG